MERRHFINRILLGTALIFSITLTHASTPVWTFIPLTATNLSLSASDSATVQYKVTNQSRKAHTLVMKPIPGITSSGCTAPLQQQQSCTLSLAINGAGLSGDVVGGPALCEQGNPSQCYQPSLANSLVILYKQASSVTLVPSVTTLGLSVNCPLASTCLVKNAALTGKARKITITNTSTAPATNVLVRAIHH